MVKTFRFYIISDSNWEAKIDNGLTFFKVIQRYFELKDYGADLNGIILVLMCRSPKLNFKRRKRYATNERLFYLDIMLDYEQMVQIKEDINKAKYILQKITNELFSTLETYKFGDLNIEKLRTDFMMFAKNKGL